MLEFATGATEKNVSSATYPYVFCKFNCNNDQMLATNYYHRIAVSLET